jgi:hypothetical protein
VGISCTGNTPTHSRSDCSLTCDPAEPRFGRLLCAADIVQDLCPKWIVAP